MSGYWIPSRDFRAEQTLGACAIEAKSKNIRESYSILLLYELQNLLLLPALPKCRSKDPDEYENRDSIMARQDFSGF